LLIENLNSANINPDKILDLGCGSGILSIASFKTFSTKVLAVDIDPESINMTNIHRELNKISDQEIKTELSDGFANQNISKYGPYNLILANILASPLISLSNSIAVNCQSNGYAILSGLLITQKTKVAKAYEKQGFELIDCLELEEWCCLLMKKKTNGTS
jgi:ribosomal protein L11 methyltransferase